MTIAIEADGLSLMYGKTLALDDVSFQLEGNAIYGLLGRNGSGKSSLLALLAAFRQPSSGTVRINGEPIWENPRATRQVCLVRESGDLGDTSESLASTFEFIRTLRPTWDQEYAERLIERFELPPKKKVNQLSRGKQSAVGIIVGLASRAPVTMFDESYLGLDAPSRYVFYEEILADFMANPRTFIISTHLIEEVSSLFEQVLILEKGKLMLREETETLRARGMSITGPAEAVDRVSSGLRILNTRELGRTKSVVIYGALDAARLRDAHSAELEIGPVPLQDLFVHLTGQAGEAS